MLTVALDNIIVALLLLVASVYGFYYTRPSNEKSEAFRELGLVGLIRGVCILGFFMTVILLGFSFQVEGE